MKVTLQQAKGLGMTEDEMKGVLEVPPHSTSPMDLLAVLYDVLSFDRLDGAMEFRIGVNLFLDDHPVPDLRIKETPNGFVVIISPGTRDFPPMEVGLYEFQGTIFFERLMNHARSSGMATLFNQADARKVYENVIDQLTRPSL